MGGSRTRGHPAVATDTRWGVRTSGGGCGHPAGSVETWWGVRTGQDVSAVPARGHGVQLSRAARGGANNWWGLWTACGGCGQVMTCPQSRIGVKGLWGRPSAVTTSCPQVSARPRQRLACVGYPPGAPDPPATRPAGDVDPLVRRIRRSLVLPAMWIRWCAGSVGHSPRRRCGSGGDAGPATVWIRRRCGSGGDVHPPAIQARAMWTRWRCGPAGGSAGAGVSRSGGFCCGV
jgi:hypothetical protein